MRNRRAFTLIEILVVVAIIALLVAILLPAFARARVQSRSVQCQSQLKQQGHAAYMYANESRGVIPGSYTDAIERLPWESILLTPPNVKPAKYVTGFRRPMIYVYKMKAIADVFYCPANKIRPWTTDNFFMHTGTGGVGGDSGRITYWWVANAPEDQGLRFHDTNGRWADGRTVTTTSRTNDGWDDEYMVKLDQRWPRTPPGTLQLSPDKVVMSTDQSRQMQAGWYFVHGGESLKPNDIDTSKISNSWKNNLYGDLHVALVRGFKVKPRWGLISGNNFAGW